MQAEKDLYDITHVLKKEKILEMKKGFHLSTIAYFQGLYYKVWVLADVVPGQLVTIEMGAICEDPQVKVKTEKFDPFYLSTISSIISMKDVLPSGLPIKSVHTI